MTKVLHILKVHYLLIILTLPVLPSSFDHFAWLYSRLSRWRFDLHQTIPSIDSVDRCREAIADEIVMVRIDVDQTGVERTLMQLKRSFADHVAYCGKIDF